MWILHFLPDSFLLYVVNTVLLVGVVSSFLAFFLVNRILRWFPALAGWYLIFQIISAVLLVAGVYFKGGYGVEMEWRDRVAELEKKVQEAEAKSQQVVVKIQEKVVYKTKIIKQQEKVYVDRVKEIAKEVDSKCEVDPRIVNELNNAASDPNKESAK